MPKIFIIIMIVSLLFVSSLLSKNIASNINNQPNPILLTKEEKEYIKLHTVTIGMVNNFYPFSFKEQEKNRGYSFDVLNLIREKSGLKIKIEMSFWSDILNKFKDNKLDLIDGISYKKQRKSFTNFSKPYYEIPNVIFARKGMINNYSGLESLKGKKVGITKGMYYYDTIKKLQLFELVEFNNSKNKMKALAYGKVDAIINNLLNGQKFISQNGYANIEILDEVNKNIVKKEDLRIGVKKEDAILLSIINKSMDAITVHEKIILDNKWFSAKVQSKTTNQNIKFTLEEKEYLKTHPIIKAHNEINWPPFNFNEKGIAKGFSIDYMNLVVSKLGIEVDYISGYSWAEFMDMLQTSNLDVMINIAKNEQRAKKISFTDVFISAKNAIYTNINSGKFYNLKDLENQTIAMPKGFFTQKFLEKNYPKIKQILVKDSLEALKLLSLGKVNATIGKKVVIDYIIENKMISNVIATSFIEDKRIISHMRFGSSKQDTILTNILQKGQNAITQYEIKKLKSKWFGAKMKNKPTNNIQYTSEEKKYLENKKEITVCVKKGWLPYEDIENGRFIGISADFLTLYAKQLPIPLKITITKNKKEILELAKSGKCDIQPLTGTTANKNRLFQATKPYVDDSIVLITKIEQPFVNDLNSLTKTVAIIDDRKRFINYLKKEYPRLKIRKVKDIKSGLKLVLQGEVFGYIGISLIASHNIQKYFSTNLKIINDFKDFKLGVGVIKTQPELLNIFNKIITNSSKVQKQKIYNKWISTTVEKEQNYTLIWQIISILTVILLIIIFFLIKQNILKNKIEDLNRNLEDKIDEAMGDLIEAKKLAKMGIWSFNIPNQKLIWCDETYKIFDITRRESRNLQIKDYLSLIHIDDGFFISNKYNEHLDEQKVFKEIHKIVTHNNKQKWVEVRCLTIFDKDGEPLISKGTIQDITENKLKDIELQQKDQHMFHQSRLAQMGEMISMIAHQWRQPLNAISLTSSNLAFKCIMNDMDNKIFKNELELIDEYAQHLSKTIDDFRGFFKEDKVQELVSLEDIINSTLNIVQTSIENKNIKIVTNLNCNTPFNTYPNEIKQVVLNIIKNAEDILLEKKIKNPVITIETLCSANKINKELIIKDNGGGVPQDIISKIFEPYFSTKKERDGTGLGLYMSKTIIEEHCGGKLNVSNDKDGAVFTLVFIEKV